jgi:hypothetical protein
MTTDAVVNAIDEFSRSVRENVSDENDILLELAQVRRQRVSGIPLGQALGGVGRPRSIVLLSQIAHRLTLGSARLRRALVTSLVQEGESVTAVAKRFEVTHQRISSILRRETE